MNIKTFCHFFDLKLILITLLVFLLPLTLNAAEDKIEDSDGDGLSDQYEESIGTEIFLSDTDGDGLSDGQEVGSNHNKPLNSDGDRYIDALDYDDDNDGLPTILESKKDTDKDGLKNYLDTDSDNDNVPDGIEAGMFKKDNNHDLIDDAFDSEQLGAIDKNGDGINDAFKLPDHNKDGIPDYLDAKYAITSVKKLPLNKPSNKKNHTKNITKNVTNKNLNRKKLAEKQLKELLQKRKKTALKNEKEKLRKIKKLASKSKKNKLDSIASLNSQSKLKNSRKKGNEKSNKKKPKKMVINRYTDTDNDGLLDSQERILGTNPLKRDSDGDKVSDAIEIGIDINNPQDSDHDKIIDALDPDDDNDGILTRNEDVNKDSSPINDDTDNDGVPNYLDANDDGDNKLTLEEGSTKDTDKDGILDYLDKNDGVKKQSIFDTPEVIVLFDGNLESLEANSEKDTNESIAEKTINEAIENSEFDSDEERRRKNIPKNGFIAWLTSLLPD